MTQYNVFISWSLEPSKSVALALKPWLKQVLQATHAFMSKDSIESGVLGIQAIADQLEAIQVGLFCVTANNQHRPWVNYEAGAISKGKKESRVIPLLFDIEWNDLQPPLGAFQHRSLFDKDDMLQLIQDVGRYVNADIDGEDLKVAFDLHWPRLKEQLVEIRDRPESKTTEPPRPQEDKIDEILETIRGISSQLSRSTAREGMVVTNISTAEVRRSQTRDRLKYLQSRPKESLSQTELGALSAIGSIDIDMIDNGMLDSLASSVLPIRLSIRER